MCGGENGVDTVSEAVRDVIYGNECKSFWIENFERDTGIYTDAVYER